MIVPMLICRDAAREVEFCKVAFEAIELSRREDSGGRVIHATLSFHDTLFMVHDDSPPLASQPPAPDGSSPVVN